MATAIASLPNEVPENNVVMKVEEKNMKVPNPPKQEPIPSAPTELSQESIHQIVQGLQQAGGATVLPNREISTSNSHIVQDEQVKPNFIPKAENTNYIEEEKSMEDLMVGYDGTVRNNKGRIIQYQYGEDGIDTIYTKTEKPTQEVIEQKINLGNSSLRSS